MENYERLDKNQQNVCDFIAKETLLTVLTVAREENFNIHAINLAILNGIKCFGFEKPFFNNICKYITDEFQKNQLEFGEKEIERINERLADLNESEIIKVYNFLSTQNLEESQFIKNFFGLSELVQLVTNNQTNYITPYTKFRIRDVATPYFRFNIPFDLLFQVLFTRDVKVEIDGRELCEQEPFLINIVSKLNNPNDPSKWEKMPAPNHIGKNEFQEKLEVLRDQIANVTSIDDFIASINESQNRDVLGLSDYETSLIKPIVEFVAEMANEK